MVKKLEKDYVLELGPFEETVGERRIRTRVYFPRGDKPKEYRITVIETIEGGRSAIAIPPVGTLNVQEKEEALTDLRKGNDPEKVASRYPIPD